MKKLEKNCSEKIKDKMTDRTGNSLEMIIRITGILLLIAMEMKIIVTICGLHREILIIIEEIITLTKEEEEDLTILEEAEMDTRTTIIEARVHHSKIIEILIVITTSEVVEVEANLIITVMILGLKEVGASSRMISMRREGIKMMDSNRLVEVPTEVEEITMVSPMTLLCSNPNLSVEVKIASQNLQMITLGQDKRNMINLKTKNLEVLGIATLIPKISKKKYSLLSEEVVDNNNRYKKIRDLRRKNSKITFNGMHHQRKIANSLK